MPANSIENRSRFFEHLRRSLLRRGITPAEERPTRRMRNKIERLWGILMTGVSKDILILFLLNLIFALRYLVSASDKIPGFPFRMDGYSYALFAETFVRLLGQGIFPLGTVWIPQVSAGYSVFLVPDPLFAAYAGITTIIGDFILAYKILLFVLYFSSALTSYFLASLLLKGRGPRLLSAASYTFSQTTLYEASLGHLSMVFGMVLLPLIVGFLLKGYRESRIGLGALSGFLLFFLIIEREDYGYMTLLLIIILMVYHVIFQRSKSGIVILNSALCISIGLLFSFPYLQYAIFSKTGAWELVASSYPAYSPTLLQLFVPIFSNVEAYLGDVTILLAVILAYGLMRGTRPNPFKYESKFYMWLYLIAVVFVILGLGASTPIYLILYDYLPRFTDFRAVSGNPTYWLPAAKICLSIMAGAGGGFLTTSRFTIRRRRIRFSRRIVTGIVLVLLVLDGGTYLAKSEPYSPIQGWSPILSMNGSYNVYQFVQTSHVPEGAAAYRYIQSDPGNYSVIEIPYVYTLPDFQYIEYLAKTNITELNPYGIPNVPDIISEIYSTELAVAANAGNTSVLASDLALIGVKYAVTQDFWGGPYFSQGLAKPTSLFKLILQSGNVSLFRNLAFGQSAPQPNLIQDSDFETFDDSIWQPWNATDYLSCASVCFDNTTSFEGHTSLKEVSTGENVIAGSNQFINASYWSPGTYVISGWNKAENVSAGSEYGVRVVGNYRNGTNITLAYAPFQTGSHTWQYSEVVFNLNNTYDLRQLAVSSYLRSGTGTAWIDDLYLGNQIPKDGGNSIFAVRTLYNSSSATIAQQNLANFTSFAEKPNQLEQRFDIRLSEPAFVIFPTSYDSGWSVRLNSTGERLPIGQYKGLIALHLGQGYYHLTMLYDSYKASLHYTSIIYSLGLGAVVAALFLAKKRLSAEKQRPNFLSGGKISKENSLVRSRSP